MKSFSLLFVSIFTTLSSLYSCTGLQLPTSSRTFVNGRTVEFDQHLDLSIAFIPRNKEFTATTPTGKGMTYTSKYAALGLMCFDQVSIMDGINEKGLTVGVFYFPGYADYANVNSSNQNKALSPLDFSNWLLTNFATLDEIKSSLDDVFIAPTVFKSWGNEPPPFHYIVYDQYGRSLVIEPLGGTLIIYENPFGVITNSPTFDWQLTNLRNYVNLHPMNPSPMVVDRVKIGPFGMGAGMLGLPGDFTPPSRFVQAFMFSSNAPTPKNSIEGILECFHLLNQFDIPKGSSTVKMGRKIFNDYTMITTAKDPSSLSYYYRTYEDQSIRMIKLKEMEMNSKEILTFPIQGKQVIFDMTKTMKSKPS